MMKTPYLLPLVATLMLSAADSPRTDRYGQPLDVEFPGKVHTDEELRADAERERPLLAGVERDLTVFDVHGGLLEAGRSFKATGYFRTEKVDGRWWLITPEGHRFFLIGSDAFHWNEGGYSTPLTVNGAPRAELTELPSRESCPAAYMVRGKVNYLGANLQRKHGVDFEAIQRDVVRKRLLSWGFNSTGKWGWGQKLAGMPYFEDSAFRGCRFDRFVDMYHPDFARNAETLVAAVTARRRGDADLIAYALDNENGWERRTVEMVMKGESSPYARAAFLEFLAKRRGGWEALAKSLRQEGQPREELVKRTYAMTLFTAEEIDGFIRESSERYHRQLAALYRKYDPDHMFMGASSCSPSHADWIRGQLSSLDFIGVHEYNVNTLDWFRRLLPELAAADKPFALLEFSFVCEQAGLRFYNAYNTCKDQRGRGLCYRHYTENVACEPLCLGFGYFIMYDQPVNRRNLGGEAHNFGLVSQQDRPYTEMIEQVKLSNGRLFGLHDGRLEPFVLAEPDEILTVPSPLKKLRRLCVPGTESPLLSADTGDRHGWFDGCLARIKISEARHPQVGVHYFGTFDLAKLSAERIVVGWFCWNRNQACDWPLLELSEDGVHFVRVPHRMVQLWKGTDYTRYRLENVQPLGKARFARVGVDIKSPAQSWAAMPYEFLFK